MLRLRCVYFGRSAIRISQYILCRGRSWRICTVSAFWWYIFEVRKYKFNIPYSVAANRLTIIPNINPILISSCKYHANLITSTYPPHASTNPIPVHPVLSLFSFLSLYFIIIDPRYIPAKTRTDSQNFMQQSTFSVWVSMIDTTSNVQLSYPSTHSNIIWVHPQLIYEERLAI